MSVAGISGSAGDTPLPRQGAAASLVRRVGPALDVAELPSFGFSHRSLMWWGTFGLMLIETTAFALAVMMYFYLRSHASRWPMNGLPPELFWGTLNTLILVVSMWPNHLAKRAAERLDRHGVQLWISVCFVFGLVVLLVRAYEMTAFNVRWDTDAYGSIVWFLIGLHTVHLVTDTFDTGVLTTLFFTGPLEGRRFVDVSENAMYWYFVVWSWVPIYAVLYWGPRG